MARATKSSTPPVAPQTVPAGSSAPEVVKVGAHRIACEGIGGALGHPRTWLEIGAAGFVDCLYCDRRFEYEAGAHAHVAGVFEAAGGH